jgi:putative MFS transporter
LIGSEAEVEESVVSTEQSRAGAALSPAARLDRLPITGWHRMLTVLVGLGSFFDLYEVFLGGVLASILTEEWKLGSTGKSLVIASAFFGMFVGANVNSLLADRFGRRRMFMINLVSYALLSLASGFSPNLTVFVVLRFLAGIGIGSELVLVDTYLAEFIPGRARGRAIAWAYVVGFLGVPLAALIGAKVVGKATFAGIAGWRWLLIAGAIGAIFVFLARTKLPESPRWLVARGRTEEADAVVAQVEARVYAARPDARPAETEAVAQEHAVEPRRITLADTFKGTYRKRTIMLWIFQILQTVGYYGFGTMAPLVLVSKGYTVTSSLGYAALSFLGYPIGALVSVPMVERLERKWLIVYSTIAIAVFGLIFGFGTNTALIVTAGFLLTVSSNVFSNAFHIYQTELFPTRVRTSAMGIGYSLSRLASAILPFVAVSVLAALGAGGVFGGAAVLLGVLCLDVAILGPRTTGRDLEEVVTVDGH